MNLDDDQRRHAADLALVRSNIREMVHDTYAHALSASLPHLEELLDRMNDQSTHDRIMSANLVEQIAFVRRVLLVDGPAIFAPP